VQDTGVLRSDWASADIACIGRAACTGDDAAVSACEREALGAVGGGPSAWPAVVMECLERGSECGGSSVTCQRLAAMTDVARAEASACFAERSCDAYSACFRDFLAARVAAAVPRWR
jgi:hypothetical protein